MSHLYFALDVVTAAIQNRFEQPDYETSVARKNFLISVVNNEDF